MHIKDEQVLKQVISLIEKVMGDLALVEMPFQYVSLIRQDVDPLNETYNSASITRDLEFHASREFQRTWGRIKKTTGKDVYKVQELHRYIRQGSYADNLMDLMPDVSSVRLLSPEPGRIVWKMPYASEYKLDHLYVMVNRFGNNPFPHSSVYVFNLKHAIESFMQYGYVRDIVGNRDYR